MMAVKKLIILILLLSILSSSAYAYDLHDENIWIFKGMYELGPGERAELDGYTVKVHTVNMSSKQPSAILLVYVNKDFKESFYIDTAANSEQVYKDELKINVLDISKGIVSLETYKQKFERVWITNIPKTALKTSDIIEDGDYSVRLDDITEEGATITVMSDEGPVEVKYLSGDHRKFSDEFMLHVIYVNKKDQEVFVETLRTGVPQIKTDVLTDKSIYDSGEKIEYRFMLTNNGTVPLHGLILTTGSSEGNVNEPKIQSSGLEPAKTKNFIIPVSAPVTPVAKTMNIRSEITGYDFKGNAYSGSGQTEVLVKPYISVEKNVETVEKPGSDIEFGTEQYFRISIILKNTASFPVAVTVKDETDPSLIPYDLKNTEWAVMVEAGTLKEIKYYAKPTTPGSFTFTNAVVQWKDNGETCTIQSDPIEEVFQIHGSKVTVEKYLSPGYALPGEEIKVTINIVNTGSREVEAVLSDNIPEQFSLVSGKNDWKGSLGPGELKEISYTVTTEHTGKLELPAATVDFINKKDQPGSSTSEDPVLYVDDMTGNARPGENEEKIRYEEYPETYTEQESGPEYPAPGRVEAAGFMMSSFIALFCMLALIPATVYLYINRMYK
ncbi:COG1470 family protein [Methanolobus halotolerans]|uniref:Uncharacterized protein n=1 Tax=Methanolobus halotolerans TaxID=2052935 RepID=A0A4E0Q8J1_9EURY|nr:DUF11 domain-containing protein [Methanolobus halotolerans]TGC08159.1 hypothetical protein CUN85_10090 [Methanolobus halotolerans]